MTNHARKRDESAVSPIEARRADTERLVTSELQIWTGNQINAICRSPLLLAKLKTWRTFAEKGCPRLSDMYASEEESALNDAMLLIQHGNDFVYVFQGDESVRKYGVRFRGTTLSHIQGDLTSRMLDMYNSCVRDIKPVYSQFNADLSTQHACWERLALPLSLDGLEGAKFVLTYSLPLDDKFEVLTTVFERSPIAMVAASAELGENKPLLNARVTLVNKRARDLLKLGTSTASIRTVADLRQWIKDGAGWIKMTDTTLDNGQPARRQTIRYEERGTGKKFMTMIEPVGRFVVFSFFEADS